MLTSMARLDSPANSTGQPSVAARGDLLRALPLFRNLGEEDMTALAEESHLHQCPAGTRLYQEGERGDEMFLILNGEVAIDRHGPEGETVRLREAGSGDYIGDMAIMGDGARFATATVIQDATLLALGRHAVLQAARNHSDILLALVKAQAERLESIVKTLAPERAPEEQYHY